MSEVDNLRLFCSNVRGLVCNWSNATSFDWNDYDIVAFNEIWEIKDYENLRVDNFEVKACKTRNTQRGGGTIIFGRNKIKMKNLNSPFVEDEKGVKTNLNNYRPISLLPVLLKVYEKVINKQLNNIVEELSIVVTTVY